MRARAIRAARAHDEADAAAGDHVTSGFIRGGEVPQRTEPLDDGIGDRTLARELRQPAGKPRVTNRRTACICAGVELARAGASDRQIAAVLGHSTMKQVAIYVAQAQQRLLAQGVQDMRDAMCERARHPDRHMPGTSPSCGPKTERKTYRIIKHRVQNGR